MEEKSLLKRDNTRQILLIIACWLVYTASYLGKYCYSCNLNGIMEYFPEKKLVSASGMAGFGSSNSIVTRRITKNFYLCGDRVTAPSYGNGLMAPRVAVCAAHEANMITRLILGEEEV